MDLTNGWDFTRASHRKAAIEYVTKVKPRLLSGSPGCRMFSKLQNLSKDSQEKREAKKEAEEHIQCVCKLYKMQVEGGREFLHEHPARGIIVGVADNKQVRKIPHVQVVMADQCMYGLKTVEHKLINPRYSSAETNKTHD